MDTHELSANLPPPRDDEPPSLRQDILDELADHLRCALRREMLTQDDGAAARKRVLDKFGDPREVARKLWVQAMRSKIMSQRITLGLLTLTTVACLVLVGLMWRTTQQYQQVNTALLEQMAKLIEADRTPVPVPPTPDATLTVRLFNGEKDGQPPKYASLSVVGTELHNDSVKGGKQPNSSGVVEFGILPHGTYDLKVRTARGETTRSVKVLRGEPHVEEFICPDEELGKDDLNIECDLPEDLREKDIAVVALFRDEPFEFGGDTWQHSTNGGISVAVNREGTRFIQSVLPHLNQPPVDRPPGTEHIHRANWIVNLVRGEVPSVTKTTNSTSRRHWTGGRFKLMFLALVTDPGRVDLRQNFSGAGVAVAAAQMMKSDLNRMKRDADWPVELDADYVVKEGQTWRITIPDHLIAEVRKQIAEAPAAKSGSPF